MRDIVKVNQYSYMYMRRYSISRAYLYALS